MYFSFRCEISCAPVLNFDVQNSSASESPTHHRIIGTFTERVREIDALAEHVPSLLNISRRIHHQSVVQNRREIVSFRAVPHQNSLAFRLRKRLFAWLLDSKNLKRPYHCLITDNSHLTTLHSDYALLLASIRSNARCFSILRISDQRAEKSIISYHKSPLFSLVTVNFTFS